MRQDLASLAQAFPAFPHVGGEVLPAAGNPSNGQKQKQKQLTSHPTSPVSQTWGFQASTESEPSPPLSLFPGRRTASPAT